MANLLLTELNKQRQSYNNSFIVQPGTIEPPIEESFYQIYETCLQFELAHEKDNEKGNIYVDDDAFPDSYNHSQWLYHKQVEIKEIEYIKARTKKMWKLIK